MKLWAVLLLIGAAATVAHAADAAVDAPTPDTTATDEAQPPQPSVEDDATPYTSPELPASPAIYLQENFDDADAANLRWTRSASKKAVDASSEDAAAAEAVAKYDGVWSVEAPQRPIFRSDLGLVLKSQAKHAAIARPLERPFRFGAAGGDQPLIVQYEVQLQDGQQCGGSYVKLLTAAEQQTATNAELRDFNDQTPYTIMFGPDKCGNDIKLHFIFRHVNPLTGAIEEKHCRKAKERLEEPFKDKQPHLYTLTVRPDSTYTIRVDRRTVNEGSLLVDFTPAVNPEKEIEDAGDAKPSDWDEREKIADPLAEKPDDWDEEAPAQIVDGAATKPDGWLDDEEELVADPQAVKPDDWDTDMDGEWEPPLVENERCKGAVGCGLWQAPQVPNPAYRGKWHAPLVDNPNYRGKWTPRRIPNPDWFEDLQPARTMQSINAVGFELWSMSGDILFDNILVTHDEELAEQWAAQSYGLKRDKIDLEAKSLWERAMRYMNYRPGYWVLYFIYCACPIAVYVTYLLRRSKERPDEAEDALVEADAGDVKEIQESFVERVLKYANDNPAMYAVFLVFVGLPLTFIMYFCCKSAPVKPYESTLGRNKKSDLNTADDDDANAAAVADDADDAADQSATAPETSAANTTGESTKSSASGYSLRNRKQTPTPAAAATAAAAADASASDSAESGAASQDDDGDSSSSAGAEAEEPVPQLVDVADAPNAAPPKPKAVESEARKRLRPRKE